MNSRARILFTVFASVMLPFTGCKPTDNKKNSITEVKSDAAYDFSPIKTRVASWIKKGYYPGASIIIAQNNKIVYEAYFGNSNKETVTFIASAGKWLAAATIAAIVDEGKLSWDDKAAKWLPELTGSKGQATLRQLLSHTSGYPDYQPKGNHRDDYQTLEESVKNIIPLEAENVPGAAFNYGGLAMQVAGRMAEVAAGKDFESLFQEKIALPLKMKNTHFTPVDMGGGHSPMLGGGARSTLHDYAHFLEMISNEGMYRGKKILKKSSVEQMQADQVGHALVKKGEYVEKTRGLNHKSIYGLGEWREELDEKGEAVLISSPSWAGAYPWIDKKNKVYGFLLAHVIPQTADEDGFSSFLSSPEMAVLTREAVLKAKK